MTAEALSIPTAAAASTAISMFANAELFDLVQRQAKLIAASDLIPKQFQGNLANCAIALEMASRLGASPFAVIQNLDVIHGRPSWRAVFLMGLVNNCGRFTPLQFKVEVTGKERSVELEIESWEGPQGNRKKVTKKKPYIYTPTRCVAWAKDRSTGEVVEGPPVSYDMALEEGWIAKDGSKWQTEMRELMLRYRAASFFAKVYASDVMLGMQTSEENYDIGPEMRQASGREVATPPAAESAPAPKGNPWKEDSVEVPSEPAPPEAKAEVMPPRQQLIDMILGDTKAKGLKNRDAADAFRAAGLLTKPQMSDSTDAELFEMTKRLDLLKAPEPAPAAESTGNAAKAMEEAPEKTDAQRKDDALASIEEQISFQGLDLNAFGKMCRDQKLMGATQALRSLGFEKLENIAGSVAFIIKTAKEGEQ